MTILKSDMQACASDKNIADKSYFDAIARYDQSMMEEALNDSLTYETCVSENRIQYNAKLGIARNYRTFRTFLLHKTIIICLYYHT